MRAYASGNKSGTYGSATKQGQATIAANMKKAGATQRQINAAQKRAAKLPNAKTTRV